MVTVVCEALLSIWREEKACWAYFWPSRNEIVVVVFRLKHLRQPHCKMFSEKFSLYSLDVWHKQIDTIRKGRKESPFDKMVPLRKWCKRDSDLKTFFLQVWKCLQGPIFGCRCQVTSWVWLLKTQNLLHNLVSEAVSMFLFYNVTGINWRRYNDSMQNISMGRKG